MIKTIRTILTNVSFAFRPSFWMGHGKVCKKWDAELNALLDHHETTNGEYSRRDDEYTFHINGVDVWVENYPYAYGRRWMTGAYYPNASHAMPRRSTRLRLRKLVKKHSATPEKYAKVNTAQNNLTVEINKLKESA